MHPKSVLRLPQLTSFLPALADLGRAKAGSQCRLWDGHLGSGLAAE